MSFLYPSLLTLLILPLLLGLVALILNSRRQSTWRKLVSEQHERELVKRRPTWKTTIPALLILLASSLAIIALARPINGFEESEEAASSRNLIIALDISRSMETQDVRPSRLEEARAAAYELIDALPSDKIGLIVFSGEADLVVPLTYDHAALKEILSHVKRDWIPTGGTNFGMVLEKATQDLQRSAPTGSNALIIFSDGEDTVGEDSKELARQAKKNNLLVITVGVGTEAGGAIPDPQGENGLYQDSQGKHVISSLKIPQLQEFAHATGGDFFIMGAGADLSEFALRAAEKIDRHDDTSSINKVPRDLFSYFLIPALGLMLLGLIMSTDWKNVTLRRFHSAPLLLLAFLLMGQSTRAQEQPATAFAQGLAAMQEADEATARDAFSRALLSEDKELQAAASYQLSKMSGELHFDELRQLYADEQGQPKQASSKELEALRPKFAQDLKNFEDTLSLQADMEQAQQATKGMKEFLTALDEEIERLKQQEQQQQQQDQDQDKSDQQDEPKDEPQDQDKSDQQDEQKDEQQVQDKSDQQDEPKDEPQDQDKSDQQDEPKDEQQEQQPETPEEKPEEKPEEQQNEEPSAQDAQAPEPKSQEEKDRDKARSILNMNLDEEKGSPVPRIKMGVRPPAKDY